MSERQINDNKNCIIMPLTTSNNHQDVINTHSDNNNTSEISSSTTTQTTKLAVDSNDNQTKSILKNKNEIQMDSQKDQIIKSPQKGGILKGILKWKKKNSTNDTHNTKTMNSTINQSNSQPEPIETISTLVQDVDVKQSFEIKNDLQKDNDKKIENVCINGTLKIESEPPPSMEQAQSLPPNLLTSNSSNNENKIEQQQSTHLDTVDNTGDLLIVTKPPLPPSKIPTINKQIQQGSSLLSVSEILQSVKVPPPRFKRKLDDQQQQQNSLLIQKLNACTEQLRLEICDLKGALGNERNAVRMLRAQYEAETRKSKLELKKLQTALESSKKIAVTTATNSKKIKDDLNVIKDHNYGNCGDNSKLIQDISSLREANRILEEKIQILNDAERRKNADIRELKDSYEIRLTQISKSAKTEISRLLEEIKTKERNIGQLKKEVNSLKNAVTSHKKDIKRIAQHPSEMKKLKDSERINGSNSNSNQLRCNTTTCGVNDLHNTPHEITERILETQTDIYNLRNKDAINSSDIDSVLSSAPQSISPQPPSSSSSSTIISNNIKNGMMAVDSSDIWQSVKNYSKEIDILQKKNEFLQKENESLKKELDTAKQQINELQKAISEPNNTIKIQQLTERVIYLEQKEDEFIKESHELKEQNELLEFRILELEESHEKWSLRSNSNPDTRDMWTDTDQKLDHNNVHHSHNHNHNDHEIIMYSSGSDHTDSGVTSPHSQHHIDDRNVISPCDLSLMDNSTNEEVKRRLAEMTKRPYIGDDDKICLLQVLTLINNLETLSEDSILVNDEMISLDLTKSKASDYGSDSSSPRSLSTDISQALSLNKIAPKNISNSQQQNQHSRIVATVLPYSSTLSTPTDSPKKIRNWNTVSLQESGVFEGDNLDGCCYSQGTQTEAEDFINCASGTVGSNTPTADLCAEIQKLNKFREKIEECTTKSLQHQQQQQNQQSSSRGSKTILSPNLSDQKRLQYYKDRLELLENKLLIYESSGDQQTKRLAERLQREVKLESLVKELQQKVENLEIENLRLEEEKCEFEEAENDTRLRLQRLEIDLEILNQRNSELEMSKEAIQSKLKEARNQCSNLQENVKEGKDKIKTLETDSTDLRNRLNLIKTSMPAILLYNQHMVNSNTKNKTEMKTFSNNKKMLENKEIALLSKKELSNDGLKHSMNIFCGSEKEQYLEQKVQELMTREKLLTESITELNRAYHETLENADTLWVEIEKEYKDRLSSAEATENQLKSKITHLEESLTYNSQCAQERITQLEESEKSLQYRITKLTKENKDITLEHENVVKQCLNLKEELGNLKMYMTGTVQENMDKEKQRIRNLEEDLKMSNKLLNEMEKTYKFELQSIKTKLQQTSKELVNIEVTNSELREEVTTLEKEIIELQNQKSIDNEKIRNLTDELRSKEDMLIQFEPQKVKIHNTIPSLAQEMESNKPILSKRQPKTPVYSSGSSIYSKDDDEQEILFTSDLDLVQNKLKTALNKIEGKTNTSQCKNVTIIEHI